MSKVRWVTIINPHRLQTKECVREKRWNMGQGDGGKVGGGRLAGSARILQVATPGEGKQVFRVATT